MSKLIGLYLLFLRIGAVTFGGGVAMVPLLHREFVETRRWISEEELTDFYAVSLCTPGVIAINVSTLIGHRRAGVPGGIVATLGFATAPIVCIVLISGVLSAVTDNVYFLRALGGIQAFACVLIADAVLRFWKKSVRSRFTLVVFLVVLTLKLLTKYLGIPVNTAFFVAGACLAGCLRQKIAEREA